MATISIILAILSGFYLFFQFSKKNNNHFKSDEYYKNSAGNIGEYCNMVKG